MGVVIDFWARQEVHPGRPPEPKRRCGNCGADLWQISQSGEISCADCEAVCPYRLQTKHED